MRNSKGALPDAIECPLCLGKGRLGRAEVLERLGMKDFARVAQLSAEEAIRLLATKEKDAEQVRWARFETELARRLAEATEKYQLEVQRLQTEKGELSIRLEEFQASASTTLDNARQQERLAAEQESQRQLAACVQQIAELEAARGLAEEQKAAEVARVRAELEAAVSIERAKTNDLSRQAKDYLQEITDLRDRKQELECEMAKAARIGRREEVDFASEVRTWAGIWIGEKLVRNGDYLMAFADAQGNPLEPSMVVDNKDKMTVTESDIAKLIRDAKERGLAIAALVVHDDTQLRHVDRQRRWEQEDGIWLLRSSRAWLLRDLEVLRPFLERMRQEGPDFFQRNSALADEIRRTFAELDEVERQLVRAGAAIGKAQALTTKYRARLAGLCDSAAGVKTCRRNNGSAKAVNGGQTGDAWTSSPHQDLA